MYLEPEHLAEVREILSFYARDLPVYAFASRVHGRTLKRISDLDLCVRAGERVDEKRLRKLRGAFEVSDLPFRVEVVDWHDMPEDFRAIIEKDLAPIASIAGAAHAAEPGSMR